jgi:hypothetical protein
LHKEVIGTAYGWQTVAVKESFSERRNMKRISFIASLLTSLFTLGTLTAAAQGALALVSVGSPSNLEKPPK